MISAYMYLVVKPQVLLRTNTILKRNLLVVLPPKKKRDT